MISVGNEDGDSGNRRRDESRSGTGGVVVTKKRCFNQLIITTAFTIKVICIDLC